ncbi:MAG: hypothetical protein LC725_09150 [Lentisphaerae bacterium]|nr:hypothetical protein [Lentisphaerota bacterium]
MIHTDTKPDPAWLHYYGRDESDPTQPRTVIIGESCFMHGRSGSRGPAPQNLVLYRSSDGLHWDNGIYLNMQEGVPAPPRNQAYSSNTVVGAYTAARPKRLLIQSSIAYADNRVNTKHWWITDGSASDSLTE